MHFIWKLALIIFYSGLYVQKLRIQLEEETKDYLLSNQKRSMLKIVYRSVNKKILFYLFHWYFSSFSLFF